MFFLVSTFIALFVRVDLRGYFGGWDGCSLVSDKELRWFPSPRASNCIAPVTHRVTYSILGSNPPILVEMCTEESITHRPWITQARDSPTFWNPGQTSPEVQNRGINGPSKIKKKLRGGFRQPPPPPPSIFIILDSTINLGSISHFLTWLAIP